MAFLTLTPPPGIYPTPVTVTVSAKSTRYQVVLSTDDDDPTIVRTIASTDKLGIEQPYVQEVNDGKGIMMLDGAFAKHYNNRYSSTTINNDMRFFGNSLNYISNRKISTGKKLLIIGDKAEGDTENENYLVKGDKSMDFRRFLEGTATRFGFDVTIKDRLDWPDENFTPAYEELIGYDCIYFMSSQSSNIFPDSKRLTQQGARNIARARSRGVGLYIGTDHGEGSEGFYKSANILLAEIVDARFEGNFDFSPGTQIQYNIDRWGNSPIFTGMSKTATVTASASDSNVVQEVTEKLTLPITLQASDEYSPMKFAIVDTQTGQTTFEQYTYFIGVEPIFHLLDQNNNRITGWSASEVNSRYVGVEYTQASFDSLGPVTGHISAAGRIIGEFENQGAGPMTITWLDTNFSKPNSGGFVHMPLWYSTPIVLTITAPFTYSDSWPFNRLLPIRDQFAPNAKFYQDVFKNFRESATANSLATAMNNLEKAGIMNKVHSSMPKNVEEMKIIMSTKQDMINNS